MNGVSRVAYDPPAMVKADLLTRAMDAASLEGPVAGKAVEALFESLGAALERGDGWCSGGSRYSIGEYWGLGFAATVFSAAPNRLIQSLSSKFLRVIPVPVSGPCSAIAARSASPAEDTQPPAQQLRGRGVASAIPLSAHGHRGEIVQRLGSAIFAGEYGGVRLSKLSGYRRGLAKKTARGRRGRVVPVVDAECP